MERNLDDLGRLVIPIEYRKQLGLENGDPVRIELKGKKIIVSNPKNDFDVEEYIRSELTKLTGKNELTIGAREMCLRILEKIEGSEK